MVLGFAFHYGLTILGFLLLCGGNVLQAGARSLGQVKSVTSGGKKCSLLSFIEKYNIYIFFLVEGS